MFEIFRVFKKYVVSQLEPHHNYVFDIKVYEPMYEREFPIELPDRLLVKRATVNEERNLVDEFSIKMGYHQVSLMLTPTQKEEFLQFCYGKSAYKIIGTHDLGPVLRLQ